MFQIAICSRCGKKIGLLTALVHDEKKLCLTCIVDDERAEKELESRLRQKQEFESQSQSASMEELEALRDSGAIPEEVFADAKKSLLQGRPVIIERAIPEPDKPQPKITKQNTWHFKENTSKKRQLSSKVSSLWYIVPIGLVAVLCGINVIIYFVLSLIASINGNPYTGGAWSLIFITFSGFLGFTTIAIVIISIILIPVRIAKRKGHNNEIAWFIFSLVLFPIALLVSLLIQPDEEITERRQFETGESIKCPYCAEWIKSEAKVCKHCGRDL